MGLTLVENALAVALGLYLVYLCFQYRKRAFGTKSRGDLRGPPEWPLARQLPDVIKYQPRIVEYFLNHSRKYGPGWTLTVPGYRFIDISKPEWIQHAQKDNFENYPKGPIFRSVMGDIFGDGIFVVDGPMWHVQRKTASAIFSGRSFKGIITPAIHRSVEMFHRVVDTHASDGVPFDLAAVFFNLTLESFVKMAFGKELGLMDLGNDKPVPFALAFDYAQGRLDHRFQIMMGWSIYEALTSHGRKMREARRFLDEYAYQIIDERAAGQDRDGEDEKKAATGTERLRKDLLGLYMDARDDQGQRMSREGLRDAVLNLIIAGRDTTAQALSWTFWRLILAGEQHLAPIRDEIERVLGQDGVVDYDNYRSLTYVNACFNEALRLHPSVPKNGKTVIAADQFPHGGPRVGPGDFVRWSDWGMARDPEVWGEDCCEYKPSRWVDEKGKLRQFGPFKAHAFNGGPRLCLGMSLATFEAVAVIVELVRNFDVAFAPGWWESVEKTEGMMDGERSPLYASSLTHPMKAPFMVTATRRVV